MIAPVGSLNKPGGVDMSGEILPHYGIFPRTVLTLFRELKDSNAVMTISVVQCGGWMYYPHDLLKNSANIRIDANHNYIGLTEIEITCEADLLKEI